VSGGLFLSGAVVRTLDPARPVAGAVLVEDGVIAAVLDDDAAVAGATRVDLRGRCVLPGFTDAHVHLPTWALTRRELRLEDARSAAEVARRVEEAVAAAARRACAAPRRGRLRPGMAADLVVLSADPLAGPDALAAAEVEATMVGGKWVHRPL